ncbi:MAG TPA: HDOD domain-containing protein [Opitutaceae bacterium]|nr:HDOD domain-containing protein [Opitutaceae bacterium]
MNNGRAAIIQLGTNLPPSIGVFGRLQRLLENPDCDVGDIVELVQIDAALTFQVLKLANSAVYGLRQRCESLEDAVGRIGFGDVHQLVGLAISRQVFQGDLASYGLSAAKLWENSVATAVLAGAIADAAGEDARNAYAAGLLRNIGRIILDRHANAGRYPGPDVAPDAHAWEKETYGYSAGEAAAMLLEHWRFAPDMVGAVCAHRSPAESREFRPSASRLHLACAVVADWGMALPGEASGWSVDLPTLELAGIDADRLASARERALAEFARCATLGWSHAA